MFTLLNAFGPAFPPSFRFGLGRASLSSALVARASRRFWSAFVSSPSPSWAPEWSDCWSWSSGLVWTEVVQSLNRPHLAYVVDNWLGIFSVNISGTTTSNTFEKFNRLTIETGFYDLRP